MFGFRIWSQQEMARRTAGVTDRATLEAIPAPTFQEFDMVLDPTSVAELDFFDDYAG